ncbi:unnamed protein product [Oppiella nova]|uniref:Nuclear receptor n=1 Tax=Oppiella nova TaxID=334625 RepID=A0A7R9LQX4_9ACAR|nr:unnamed protein product [Oppiella nova]CAG2165733.1 unnamed protein product [Oppiella nova]
MSTKLKSCVVCGEHATGIHFDALSCESCKAFFRRNAHKFNSRKCAFGDNCDINVLNRKFCQKCRLNKCFSVGMRKDWILNEEEKELRRKKIQENKIKRLNTTKQTERTVSPESVEEFMLYSTINFDSIINEILATITSLSGFQDIYPDDQLALVKYGCFEIKMLRANLFFHYEHQCWENNATIKCNLTLFKNFNYNNIYTALKNCLLKFAIELDRDHLILTLLMPIILFNPERPHIIHKEVVIFDSMLGKILTYLISFFKTGNNFGVISCESCKAFFRRNAHKTYGLKCMFENNCYISVVTRKFCKQCRLTKCFAVGMKKEWILTERERDIRRKKIEENKIKKLNKYLDTCLIERTVSPQLCEYSEKAINSDLDSRVISDEDLCEYIKQIDNFYSNEYIDEINVSGFSDANHKDIPLPLPLSLEALVHSLNINETHIAINKKVTSETNNNNSNELSNEIINGLELAVIIHPSTQHSFINFNGLNKYEFNCLNELLSALSQMGRFPFTNCNIPSVRNTYNSMEEVMKYWTINFDPYISLIVGTIQKLSGFQEMCLNDQIALIKYGCLEFKILRVALYFNYEYQCWALKDNNDTIKANLSMFKSYKQNNSYNMLKKYLLRVANELDCDHLILILTST